MNGDKRYAYWMELADYDLETAEAMLRTERFLYVGFMCHQSVEKAIKAYHWKTHKTEPPYIHMLDRLAEKAGLLELFTEKQMDLVDELNPLNIEARYPKSKEFILKTLNKDRCMKILNRTQEFISWIKNK